MELDRNNGVKMMASQHGAFPKKILNVGNKTIFKILMMIHVNYILLTIVLLYFGSVTLIKYLDQIIHLPLPPMFS